MDDLKGQVNQKDTIRAHGLLQGSLSSLSVTSIKMSKINTSSTHDEHLGMVHNKIVPRVCTAHPGPQVCWAWYTTRRCKSSAHPSGGEGLVKRKGVTVR